MEAYRQVNNIYALEEWLGTPYAYAMRMVARYLNHWKREFFDEKQDQILLFTEEGTKHKGDMEQVLVRDGLPVPHYIPKSLAMGQAALTPTGVGGISLRQSPRYAEEPA